MPDKPLTGQTLSGWTIVFDLDGTLVETAPDLLGALNHVLAYEALAPVSLPAIRTMIGHGAKAMIREGLRQNGVAVTEATVERLWPLFIDYYHSHIADFSQPFDGVVDVLSDLQADGAILAVCTNKTQALSDRLLAALDLISGFQAVVGADSVPNKKPDGDHILRTVTQAGGIPSRAIMVGDSRTDERAALDAGLPFMFVTFGYEPAPPGEIEAAATINHFSEFWSALSGLVS
ncbi:MAG: HAD-IA family hydrolase [Pseudomonadota bacterium]